MYSDPTWGNHKALFTSCGLACSEYRYLDKSSPSTPKLDFAGMMADLEACDPGTLVLLQACAHNPTGVDPTEAQWLEIAEVCKRRNLQVFMDNAYQGFASGDTDKDAFAIRHFVKENIPVMVACSFAKNMGLYGERVGCLHVVAGTKEETASAISQLKVIARTTYSNPPQFGSLVVTNILSDAALGNMWRTELEGMAGRIEEMRKRLKAGLVKATGDSPDKWNHITSQIGMFSYTGLSKEQVAHCAEEGGLFMLDTGRVSMAGMNGKNVDRVATVMANAIKACPSS